jgi:hypothetical protein
MCGIHAGIGITFFGIGSPYQFDFILIRLLCVPLLLIKQQHPSLGILNFWCVVVVNASIMPSKLSQHWDVLLFFYCLLTQEHLIWGILVLWCWVHVGLMCFILGWHCLRCEMFAIAFWCVNDCMILCDAGNEFSE